jgi:hypothetical protein
MSALPGERKRANLEGPCIETCRWTRAVEDQSAPIPEETTSELGGSMRGQTRRSPVLVQRAVSEDPRWTRAVGDHLARPQGERWRSGGCSMRAVQGPMAAP